MQLLLPLLLVVVTVGLVACGTLTPDLTSDDQFTRFIIEHKKSYRDASEYSRRHAIFKENIERINKLNEESPSATFAINEHTDLTTEEFAAVFHHATHTAHLASDTHIEPVGAGPYHCPISGGTLCDWRVNSIVTSPSSYPCGQYDEDAADRACRALALLGSLESTCALAQQHLIPLSIEQLVYCSGKSGCSGGDPVTGMNYALKYGMDPAGPFTSECEYEPSKVVCKYSNYTAVPKGNETALAEAIQTRGPVFVAANCPSSLQFYASGIFREQDCSTSNLDCSLLAVGYGNGFYILRNNWGTSWGMNGYVMWARNENNMCGVASDAFVPTAI